MNNTLHTQIENYLLNKMTEEEARIFSERIAKDYFLKEEVELTALIIGATRKVGENKDLDDIQILRNASTADIGAIINRRKSKIIQRTLFLATSSVAVVLVAVLLFNFNKRNNQSEELFASFYHPYVDDSGMARGGDERTEHDSILLTNALSLYNNEKYADALALFDQLSEETQYSVTVFKAVCLLEIGKSKQAVRLLETSITENGEGWEYYQDAQWFLALAYLKSGRRKDAVNLLIVIKDVNMFYAPISTELLKKL